MLQIMGLSKEQVKDHIQSVEKRLENEHEVGVATWIIFNAGSMVVCVSACMHPF